MLIATNVVTQIYCVSLQSFPLKGFSLYNEEVKDKTQGGTWIAEWLFGSMLAETPSIIPGSSSMSAGGPRAKGFLLYVRLPPPNMST